MSSRLFSSKLVKGSRVLVPRQFGVRHSHALYVPYVHQPVTEFENGVPKTQVRNLRPEESQWDFWTSSEAFQSSLPRIKKGLFTHVPYGESWVIEKFGNFSHVAEAGVHFLVPGVHKVRAVKNSHPIVMGVLSTGCKAKDGTKVDGYAVIYAKVEDAYQSAYFEDPQTGKFDSERALANLARQALTKEISKIAAVKDTFSETDGETVRKALLSALRSQESAFAISVLDIEFRGAFPQGVELPNKLKAMEEPVNDPNVPGHAMSADYWADVLTPPFFKKFKFGSLKEYETKTGVTLDWVIPSPAEYHHFNQLPRYCIDVDEAKERGLLSETKGKIESH